MATTTSRTAGHARALELVYLYGIAPSAVAIRRGLTGVGDPPGRVQLVRHGQIAAVTSAIPAGRPVGRPSDLRAHASVLDTLASVSAVLPMRFGSVLADRDTAVEQAA